MLTLRARQRRNLLATLLLSEGVPLILAGDDLGRTQSGNNNAYCHDDPISWVDWSTVDTFHDLTEFVATLCRFRLSHPSCADGDSSPKERSSGSALTASR